MQTIRFGFSIALVFGLALTACSKKEETDQGAFTKTQPSAATSQPAQAASQPQGAAQQHDAVQPNQAASQQAAAHGAVTSAAPFSGEVKLGTGLGADQVKSSDVLFVMARQSVGNGQAGQLIATQRHTPVTLPLKFSMTSKDTMVEGIPFTGPWIVTARLDRDGDPMTKDEGDLYATAGEVKGGQNGVALVLTKGMPPPMQPALPVPPATQHGKEGN